MPQFQQPTAHTWLESPTVFYLPFPMSLFFINLRLYDPVQVLFCTQRASLQVSIPASSSLPAQTGEQGKDRSLLSLGPCPCTEQDRNKTPMGYRKHLPMRALDAYEEASCFPQLFGFIFSKWCCVPYLYPYLQHFSPYPCPDDAEGVRKQKTLQICHFHCPQLRKGTAHIFLVH